jgi:hypothetical protein
VNQRFFPNLWAVRASFYGAPAGAETREDADR